MPKYQKKDSSVPSKTQDELDDEEIDLYITPAATLEHEAGLVWLKTCIDSEINTYKQLSKNVDLTKNIDFPVNTVQCAQCGKMKNLLSLKKYFVKSTI